MNIELLAADTDFVTPIVATPAQPLRFVVDVELAAVGGGTAVLNY